jgi:cellobiose-specific phosphotransferase system component IIB
MLTVAIVCGAGASSTFLARRLSDIAAASGYALRFVPSPLESVTVDTADLVALTSHIVSDEVTADLSERGIAHVLLPATVRGGFGADDALASIADYFGNNGLESEAKLTSAESKEN